MKLLHQTGPYAPDVAESIVRETAGLPLALLEVGAELTPGQRLGEAPLPNPLPVGDRILAEYRSRLSTLPAGPKLAVGVVAAAGSDISAVVPGLALLGLPSDVLDEPETAGVVNTTPAGPTFRHPLLRAAALSELTGSQRRRAEWALANTVEDAERRATHLVRSAEGPSEEMAEMLEAAAEIVVSRMGSLAAATIWADAARLTPDGPATSSTATSVWRTCRGGTLARGAKLHRAHPRQHGRLGDQGRGHDLADLDTALD